MTPINRPTSPPLRLPTLCAAVVAAVRPPLPLRLATALAAVVAAVRPSGPIQFPTTHAAVVAAVRSAQPLRLATALAAVEAAVRPSTLRTALACTLACTLLGALAAPAADEPFLRDLPPGVFITKADPIAPAQRDAIATKLGAKVERLTNATVRFSSRPLRINFVTAPDRENALTILKVIGRGKKHPSYCIMKDLTVVEFPGDNPDRALVQKATWELALRPKPKKLRYSVLAGIAPVEKADYMECTPLLNHLLAANAGGNADAEAAIRKLLPKFTFGDHLQIRSAGPKVIRLDPEPLAIAKQPGGWTRYQFAKAALPERHHIPHVTVAMEIETDAMGFTPAPRDAPGLSTAATPFWPAKDRGITALARKITRGENTRKDKVDALLEWLKPGRNIRYGGRTGSRWGVAKVLEQKFGHCWDSSDLFVTLCRAADIPARQVAGWLYGTSGHVWAEYHNGDGWQQVDPTGGTDFPCGIYHIPWLTTNDGHMPIVYVAMPKIEILGDP